MPYEVRQVDEKFCVFKVAGGASLGCHSTRSGAYAQIAAIEASEEGASKEAIDGLIGIIQDAIQYTDKQNNSKLRKMLLVTSNAYRDREKEIVSQEALEKYVSAQWNGDTFVGQNILQVWHNGDAIGKIKFAAMHGPFLIEVFEELPDKEVVVHKDDATGVELKGSIKEVWDGLSEMKGLGASHRFFYKKNGDGDDSVYRDILKWESSVLPRMSAANVWTFAQIIE